MELSQYFTGLVALVCAIHLAGVVGRSVCTFSAKNVLEDAGRPWRQRSDWYLFFYCSDLTGAGTVIRKPAQLAPPVQPGVYAPGQRKRSSRASLSC
jgi:hypothetical protein